jgi:hypothetical protein
VIDSAPKQLQLPSGAEPKIVLRKSFQGCQIFLGTKYQNGEHHTKRQQNSQVAIKYTICYETIPNGNKIYQHFPLQCPTKYTQIEIFGKQGDQMSL